MREHLIGYLLEALEPQEHAMVEAQLGRDPQLQRELETISRALAPLKADRGHYDPPLGLADRTIHHVDAQIAATAVERAPVIPAFGRARWSMPDLVVAAGIVFAATMLLFPAMSQSRFAAGLTGCQNNLRQIGAALASYSSQHRGYFPNLHYQNKLEPAGMCATKLVEHGYLPDQYVLICPASPLNDTKSEFQVPRFADLEQADAAQLARLHERMGGSYGYNLGYVANGQYQVPKNRQRSRFALVADAPSAAVPHFSLNHNQRGQNVLFEDGHVQYLTTCRARGCNDDIFVNDQGEVAAGLHENDSVLGPSRTKPLASPNMIQLVPAGR